ncbi:hypothetical protein [Duncaniella muris]|uniref:hypothetical protein n=1 Tax=Duncaniella muris TaxID=2094150 RepID=UPI001374F9B9|nr:hypothetical protein [Duncaniella muris]
MLKVYSLLTDSSFNILPLGIFFLAFPTFIYTLQKLLTHFNAILQALIKYNQILMAV